MSTTSSKAIKLANEIEAFPLENCGPSDNPDKQTAYLNGFRDLVKRFIAAAKATMRKRDKNVVKSSI